MSDKIKHQKRQLASGRIVKLAKQCGFFPIATRLRNRGYSFEQAHMLLFGVGPEARQKRLRHQQREAYNYDISGDIKELLS